MLIYLDNKILKTVGICFQSKQLEILNLPNGFTQGRPQRFFRPVQYLVPPYFNSEHIHAH